MTVGKLFRSLSGNTIMTKLNSHFQRATLIALSTDKHYSLKMISTQVVEMSVTDNSSFQNFPHPDNHTRGTTE